MEESKKREKQAMRESSLDVLRCLAMMMVVMLHFLGKGELLGDTAAPMTTVGAAAWALEALCIVAVNVYMMISGYFLCNSRFKVSRLVQLYLQVWLYSVGVGAICLVTGIVPAGTFTTYDYLTLIFPVSMGHYWFLTAYVLLYVLLPLLGTAVRLFTKKQLRLVIFLLLLFQCLIKSILPLRMETDAKGYDCLWYVCVFLAAAYIRRFGLPFLTKKGRGFFLYLAASACSFAELMLFHGIYLKTGSFSYVLEISYEYNHIFPFLAAVGLFCGFLQIAQKRKNKRPSLLEKAAVKAAPYTLGVYLLHENIGLRYAWQKWFGASSVSSVTGLLLSVLAAAVIVFCAGIAVDFARSRIMGALHRSLCKLNGYGKAAEKLAAADALFIPEAERTGRD